MLRSVISLSELTHIQALVNSANALFIMNEKKLLAMADVVRKKEKGY
jgi:hypothetical protein